MAITKTYRISYKDGRTQELQASGARVNGTFIYFEKDGTWVHHVAAESVESFGHSEIAEAKQPNSPIEAVY